MIHELKCWPKYFRDVWTGRKNFEVRKNDRNFQVGDSLLLMEWNPEREKYTGVAVKREIIYILDDPAFVKDGYVIMGLK